MIPPQERFVTPVSGPSYRVSAKLAAGTTIVVARASTDRA